MRGMLVLVPGGLFGLSLRRGIHGFRPFSLLRAEARFLVLGLCNNGAIRRSRFLRRSVIREGRFLLFRLLLRCLVRVINLARSLGRLLLPGPRGLWPSASSASAPLGATSAP